MQFYFVRLLLKCYLSQSPSAFFILVPYCENTLSCNMLIDSRVCQCTYPVNDCHQSELISIHRLRFELPLCIWELSINSEGWSSVELHTAFSHASLLLTHTHTHTLIPCDMYFCAQESSLICCVSPKPLINQPSATRRTWIFLLSFHMHGIDMNPNETISVFYSSTGTNW